MIRKALLSDVKICQSIAQDCGKALRDSGIDQWTEDYPSEAILQQDVANEDLYVLEMNAEIVGMIVLNEMQDPEYSAINWLTSKEDKNLVVHRLAVNPNHQGNGFARILMDFAEELGRINNYKSIRLDTFSQNIRNQKFYENRGYQRLGEIMLSYRTDFPYICYEFNI